jgi:hypothetical protein
MDTIQIWVARCIKSKTMIFAMLLAMLGAAQSTLGLFNGVLTPETYGVLTMAVSVGVAALRVVTTTPIQNK